MAGLGAGACGHRAALLVRMLVSMVVTEVRVSEEGTANLRESFRFPNSHFLAS